MTPLPGNSVKVAMLRHRNVRMPTAAHGGTMPSGPVTNSPVSG